MEPIPSSAPVPSSPPSRDDPLSTFERAINMLKKLRAKPSGTFVDVANAEELDMIAEFLKQVAVEAKGTLIGRRKPS